MKVAFVHDWLVTYRGGERVLEQLLALYPDAPIYTLFYHPDRMPLSIRSRKIHYPKLLNPLWKVKTALLPLLPSIIESFDLSAYDLVISTSSCVAKGVVTGPDTLHLCYLHSPMRYIWDQRTEYLASLDRIPGLGAFAHYLSSSLRVWDAVSSHRVDRFVVNSNFVKRRVKKYYGREASVVHPPVDWRCFASKVDGSASADRTDYFLAAGAFVSYKKLCIAIEACERAKVHLVVAGSGPEEKRLRALAGGYTRFVIQPNAAEWIDLFRGAKAFLFPAVEDFGITAIEAMASGIPVIAYKGGGALDFIEPGITGEFFAEQSVDSLCSALTSFDQTKYGAQIITDYAKRFDFDRFLDQMRRELDQLIREKAR